MKKREKKLEHKEKAKKLHPEDQKIVNQQKNKKREDRKKRTHEEDEFDQLLDTYKAKVLKKMKLDTGESGTTFEEVDVSD